MAIDVKHFRKVYLHVQKVFLTNQSVIAVPLLNGQVQQYCQNNSWTPDKAGQGTLAL